MVLTCKSSIVHLPCPHTLHYTGTCMCIRTNECMYVSCPPTNLHLTSIVKFCHLELGEGTLYQNLPNHMVTIATHHCRSSRPPAGWTRDDRSKCRTLGCCCTRGCKGGGRWSTRPRLKGRKREGKDPLRHAISVSYTLDIILQHLFHIY